MTDLTPEMKLAQIKSERAALAAAKAKRDSEALVQEQLEHETLALADERAIAAAEEKHGPLGKKLAAVHTDLGVVIVKRPNHLLFRRFQDSGEATYEEFDKLVRPCVVHPELGRFDAILEELPATMARLGNAVAILAGVKLKEAQGK